MQSIRGQRPVSLYALLSLFALVAGAGVYVSAAHTDMRARQAVVQRVQLPVSLSRKPHRAAVRATSATPALLVSAPAHITSGWATTALVHGRPAAWLAERSGVTLMRFDQSLVHLTLHAGYNDGGESGWTYGDRITPREVHSLVAGFNGGFKLTYSDVGFLSGHHVAVALKSGLASIVTYTDGTSDIGAWRDGVPSPGQTVYSVLQNQHLLVDRALGAGNLTGCVFACWGGTVGSVPVVARSGLGVTQSGQLVWAAGERLTPSGLADALIAAGAVRAIELDINPDWVAGYLYAHHPGGPTPMPVVPGQHGIAGALFTPNSRDFLAVVAN
jgi:hypothetical protein